MLACKVLRDCAIEARKLAVGMGSKGVDTPDRVEKDRDSELELAVLTVSTSIRARDARCPTRLYISSRRLRAVMVLSHLRTLALNSIFRSPLRSALI